MSAFDAAADRVAQGADARSEADALVAMMTLEEKLGCLDGDLAFWPGIADLLSGGYHAHGWPAARVERLGIPGLNFADGPRGCVLGESTTFPVSMARGASFGPSHATAPRWCRSTAASPARPMSARPSAWSASPRSAFPPA